MHPVQYAWEDQWAMFEPVRMLLASSTAGARQPKTPIRSKSSPRKTACLDLTSGSQPLQGTGKHVVKSDLAQPVPYMLGVSYFTYVHMEPFSIHMEPFSKVYTKFTCSKYCKFALSLH